MFIETTNRPRSPEMLFRNQFSMLNERLGSLVRTALLAEKQGRSKTLVEGTAALAADCMTEIQEKTEILIRLGRQRGYLPADTKATMTDAEYRRILPKYKNADGSITISISR